MKIPVEIQKVQNRHPKLISFHHLAKIKLADQKENNKLYIVWEINNFI